MRLTSSVQQIAELLQRQAVICYPTEAVWGLGCHPQATEAFKRILAIKQRSVEKGVILVVADFQQIEPYAEVSAKLKQQLKTMWPGFVTCLLPKSAACPPYLTGKYQTVAVRMTAYEPLKQLCRLTGSAVVSTSANISHGQPVRTINQAQALFNHQVDAYWDAALGNEKKPSRIIFLSENKRQVIRD